MQLAERALKRFDLALVVDLLPFGELQRFEDFLHLIERAPEFVDDFVDLFDGPADARRFAERFRFRLAFGFKFSGRLGRLGGFGALNVLGGFSR
jgi:hypothetical protein